MILFFLILVYTVANIYVLYRIIGWVTSLSEKLNNNITKCIVSIVYMIGYLSVIVGYFLPISEIQKIIQKFANYFLGAIVYIVRNTI